MKTRLIIILLSVFTIATIGLTAVQIFQTHRAAEISDDLFNTSIHTAMDNAIQQIGQMKPEDFVNEKDRYIVSSYRRIDELNQKIIALLTDHQDLFFDIQRLYINVAMRDSIRTRKRIRFTPSEQDLISQYNTLLSARNRLIEDIEETKSSNTHIQLDYQLTKDNFDYQLLESIIHEELVINGINVAAQIGVYNTTTNELLYCSNGSDSAELTESPHRYSFKISQLPSSCEYCIVLKLPMQYMFVKFTNYTFAILSLLLLAIIFATYFISMRMMFNMKKLDGMKTTFINNMTHEIKTPIATISLACEMLNDPGVDCDSETRRNFVSTIADEARRMRVLVETILQNSKMSNKQVQLSLKEINISEITSEAARSFQLSIKNCGGTLTEQYAPYLPPILGDQLHLSNLVHNLIDNAIKYSNGAPEITVQTYMKEKKIVLRVSDKGIGIAKEDQKHIFEKFYRVSTGNIHNVKGFGIGLNYVANVVKLHHAKINLESEIDKGSTFEVLFDSIPDQRTK